MAECCVCAANGKYKCPQCSFKTCSLACVKAHKLVYGCSGISKPLRFISLKDFNENNLQKDMNFLMDIIRTSDQSYKLVTKLSRVDNRKRFSFLINECNSRRIRMKIMPKAMDRHARNTSMYDKAQKILIWQIEWVFLCGKSRIVCESSGNGENLSLDSLVGRAVEEFFKVPLFVMDYEKVKKEDLVVLWLVRKEKVGESVEMIYIEINKERTLMDTLPEISQQCEIIEYPTFYLTPSTELANLTIIKL